MNFVVGIFVLFGILRQCLGQFVPSGLACTSSNSTTLVFTWSRPSDPHGQVQGYHMNLARTDGLQTDNIPQIDIPGYLVETYTVYGVGKYAVYTANVHCYTASGNEADVTVSCRSQHDAPNGAPTFVNATGISYTEIDVVWNEIEEIYRNGILEGYKIVYFALDNWTPKTATVSNTTFNYVIGSLDFDTKYVVSVLGYTVVGDGPQTTDIDKTLGAVTKQPEVEEKYYCYEVIPGVIEVGWDAMPCTVYVGAIGFFFLIAMACAVACCCCKGGAAPVPGAGGGVGMGGGSSTVEPFEYDDDDDDYSHNGDSHTKSMDQLTSRDVFIASPLPGDYDYDEYDEVSSPEPPPAAFIPRVGAAVSKPDLVASNTAAVNKGFDDDWGATPHPENTKHESKIVVEDEDDGFV